MRKIVFFLSLGLSFVSCKKEQPTRSNGFNSSSEIKENSSVQNAIRLSSILTYDGTNPPNIEGTYMTDSCTYYNASSNCYFIVGGHPSSTFKLFGQTSDGHIQFFEENSQQPKTSSGTGEFITGTTNNFTLWMQSFNSDGSTTIGIISGRKVSVGRLDVTGMTVYTNNPPKSYIVGDWWAYKGTFGSPATSYSSFHLNNLPHSLLHQ